MANKKEKDPPTKKLTTPLPGEEAGLGDIARDKVTGFSGVVIGVHHWLHGCRRLSIQPREMKDGKPIDALSFDEMQIEVTEQNAIASTARPTGGPDLGEGKTRRSDPRR